MTWGRKRIRGVEYDLSHLNPFAIDVTPKADGAPTYKVEVSFGSHTFTREWDPAFSPDLKFTYRGEERCFCTSRHELSLRLPTIINEARNGRAHFSQSRNYLIVRNLPGLTGPYAVFFNLEKSRSNDFDARMFVVSAYEKLGLPTGLSAITLPTLVAKTVRGEPIIPPKRK